MNQTPFSAMMVRQIIITTIANVINFTFECSLGEYFSWTPSEVIEELLLQCTPYSFLTVQFGTVRRCEQNLKGCFIGGSN